MSTKEHLDKLQKQKAKIEARIQQISSKEKVKERKQDTRRKILIGAYYLDKARKENAIRELNKLMRSYLTRDSDKKLFTLTVATEAE